MWSGARGMHRTTQRIGVRFRDTFKFLVRGIHVAGATLVSLTPTVHGYAMATSSRLHAFVRGAQGWALVTLPASFIAIFALHFRSLGEFLSFRMRYEPVPADTVVRSFIEAGNRLPMMHDPHVIGTY
jgi:hypothetical protein